VADIRLQRLDRGHVQACADMHLAAFPGFFLSRLGPRFLREFYAGFVDDPGAVTAVAVAEDGHVRGVVVGTLQPAGFFLRLLKRRWWAFAGASIAVGLRHPRRLPRLLGALRYRGAVPLEVSGALLSSICVAPDAQGAGVGRGLLTAFEEVVDNEGLSAYLVTDRDDNDATNLFYISNGWRLAGSYTTPQGRAMNCYVHDTAKASS
jgi:ribosomal protein S18 acetylase RimI-like enzyme